MGSILQNGMLSESKLAAWLAAIIAEIAFYQWSLQEMEYDSNKILIAVSCTDCSTIKQVSSIHLLHEQGKFCYYNTVADWMPVVSADLDKINSLEDHSISSVSEHNIYREIN